MICKLRHLVTFTREVPKIEKDFHAWTIPHTTRFYKYMKNTQPTPHPWLKPDPHTFFYRLKLYSTPDPILLTLSFHTYIDVLCFQADSTRPSYQTHKPNTKSVHTTHTKTVPCSTPMTQTCMLTTSPRPLITVTIKHLIRKQQSVDQVMQQRTQYNPHLTNLRAKLLAIIDPFWISLQTWF